MSLGEIRSPGCYHQFPWSTIRRAGHCKTCTRCRKSRRSLGVEGWSAIGSWQGTPLRDFLKRVAADTRAKYVWFRCAEGYSNTIDMATAPQTQMTRG
jgi:hypothetical protein